MQGHATQSGKALLLNRRQIQHLQNSEYEWIAIMASGDFMGEGYRLRI